jgi:hypothetical protein
MDRRFKKKMERYWKKEREKSLREIHSLDIDSWFDYWHTHPDWKFKGNRSNEMKAWVASITYDLLNVVEELTKHQGNRLQVWATLCEDTGNNAIYIHSDNPNSTPYPNDYENVMWGVRGPAVAAELIDQSTHETGTAKYEEEVVYYIRKRA